jgi:hypothetical protein
MGGLKPAKLSRRRAIQGQIEDKHIHPRLAQQTQETAFGLLLDKLTNAIFGHAASFRNTGA